MSVRVPRNDLGRLQRMVASPDTSVIGWDRARGPTGRRLNIDDDEAQRFIRETVASLTRRHFAMAVEQREIWFDVYGCYRRKIGWFVKIGEDEDGAIVLSHHEPEWGPMVLANGDVIHPVEP